ncbi:MAG: phage tail protein [Bacteroidota bacterium]
MKSLLPPNATRFQRDLERVNAFCFDADRAINSLINLKSDPPEAFLYWLIWEYGLDEILPYIADPRRLIADGLQWQRLRGTPQSLRIALGWIGVDLQRIEEEPPGAAFFQYQLELDGILHRTERGPSFNLCELSAPIRARLARIYNREHDLRPRILSEDSVGAYLSDYSGVRHAGVRLSFGQRFASRTEAKGAAVAGVRIRRRSTSARFPWVPKLGAMRIEYRAVLNHRLAHGRLVQIGYAHHDGHPMGTTRRDWFADWGQRSWREGAPGIPRRLYTRGVCRSLNCAPLVIGRVRRPHRTVEVEYRAEPQGGNRAPGQPAVLTPELAHRRQMLIHYVHPDGLPLATTRRDWYAGWQARPWRTGVPEVPLWTHQRRHARAFAYGGPPNIASYATRT